MHAVVSRMSSTVLNIGRKPRARPLATERVARTNGGEGRHAKCPIMRAATRPMAIHAKIELRVDSIRGKSSVAPPANKAGRCCRPNGAPQVEKRGKWQADDAVEARRQARGERGEA
eukprot:5598314-Prymnesium_polylepis.1